MAQTKEPEGAPVQAQTGGQDSQLSAADSSCDLIEELSTMSL